MDIDLILAEDRHKTPHRLIPPSPVILIDMISSPLSSCTYKYCATMGSYWERCGVKWSNLKWIMACTCDSDQRV